MTTVEYRHAGSRLRTKEFKRREDAKAFLALMSRFSSAAGRIL